MNKTAIVLLMLVVVPAFGRLSSPQDSKQDSNAYQSTKVAIWSPAAVEYCRRMWDYKSDGSMREHLFKCMKAYDTFISELNDQGYVDPMKELASLGKLDQDSGLAYIKSNYSFMKNEDQLQAVRWLFYHEISGNHADSLAAAIPKDGAQLSVR
jgi:hypothetical protein